MQFSAIVGVTLIFAITTTCANCESERTKNDQVCFTDYVTEDGEYFEGDINMPIETIIKYYDFNETEKDILRAMFTAKTNCHVNKRAVIDDEYLVKPLTFL